MLEGVLRNIDNKLETIKSHPEYSKHYYDSIRHSLQEESLRHSWDMEVEELTEGWKILNDAFDYLSSEGISTGSLMSLGNLVEPNCNPGFRRHDVSFGGFHPETYTRIIYRVENFSNFYNENKEFHPIIKATELHNMFIEIHPYEDGNGRAARLISNFYLISEGFLPYVIQKNERHEYISLLKEVMIRRFNSKNNIYNPSTPDNIFNLYLANKVLESVLNTETKLSKRRTYEIGISKTKKINQVIKGITQSIHECKYLGQRVTINKNGNNIQVIGDVSLGDIQQCVNWYTEHRPHRKFAYKVNTIY